MDFDALGEWAVEQAKRIRKAMEDYLTPGPQDEEFRQRSREAINRALEDEE